MVQIGYTNYNLLQHTTVSHSQTN